MVVLSNDLRNLLTEDSLSSIMNAGTAPNGHLVPEREESSFSNNVQIDDKEISIQASQEKESGNIKMTDIEDHINKNMSKYDEHLALMTKKINDLIKGFNVMEQTIKTMQQTNVVNKQEKLVPTEEVKEEKKQNINPRSVASLPPELSIANVFSCNGKKF